MRTTGYAPCRMKLLITGAAGMLGTDVQAAALAAGDEVVALARADLDISDPAAGESAVTAAVPDAVINCAAYTKVDAAEEHPDDAAAVNATGAGNLAQATAAAGAWLVHVSTDYVFDGTKTSGPYVESDPTGPRSVYGSTKLLGEHAIAIAAPESHTIVRSSWLFGNHGPCFPATMLRLGSQRDELNVVDDQRGSPTFTPDLAQALLTLARTRVLGVTHVAGGGECTWFEFAREILRLGGSAMRVHPITTAEYPLPAQRPAYSVLRSERGGEVPVLRDWHEGLAQYMQGVEAEVS